MKKLSIIVPIYNAEHTLERCIGSIAKQSYGNYECILIDDGSSDTSALICKRICDQDKRFIYFFQENAGPSAARNRGLDCASGDVVIFVDSDDFLCDNALEIIARSYNDKYQAIFHSYRLVHTDGELIEEKLLCLNTRAVPDIYIELSNKDMFGYTWIKSFDRSVIGNIRFRLDLNLFEDEVFTCNVLQKCEAIGIIEQPVINYVVGDSNALTARVHQDYPYKREMVYQAWKELLRESTKVEYLRDIANNAISTSKYYYYEKNIIDEKQYLSELANCEYMHSGTTEQIFSFLVLHQQTRGLRLLKNVYLLRNRLVKILKR